MHALVAKISCICGSTRCRCERCARLPSSICDGSFETQFQVEHITAAKALVPPKVLAAARAMMCNLCIIIIGFNASESISAGQSFGRWLSFLTNWTWVLCLFVLFPALGVSLYFIRAPPSTALQPSAWMRVHWIMWEMAGIVTTAPHPPLSSLPHPSQQRFPSPSPFFSGPWSTSPAGQLCAFR